MSNSKDLSDELLAIKREISHLLGTSAADMLDAAKSRSEEFADQIRATLGELGETLSHEEEQVEQMIAERPIVALASAFALGVAIGFMLRRH